MLFLGSLRPRAMIWVVFSFCLFAPARSDAATIDLVTRFRTFTDGEPPSLTTPCLQSISLIDVATGGSLSLSCSFGQAAASGVFGAGGLDLGASASLLLGPAPSTAYRSQGTATFRDTVTATGGTPGTAGFVSYSFALSGTVASDCPAGQATSCTLRGTDFNLTGSLAVNSVFRRFETVATPATMVMVVPVVFGATTALTIAMNAQVDIESPFNGSSGSIDFLNTASLTEVVVLDANLQPITGGRLLSGTPGLVYQPEITPIPEPATLVMTGIGCGVVLRRVRQRRKRLPAL
jgi:hypothetical protein